MLRGALLLLVLCALAAAFPTLPPESTVETQDLTSFPSADVESTTDLLVLTTDQDQTTPSEPITEFSADMVTATPTSVEENGENLDDYNPSQSDSFLNEDLGVEGEMTLDILFLRLKNVLNYLYKMSLQFIPKFA